MFHQQLLFRDKYHTNNRIRRCKN